MAYITIGTLTDGGETITLRYYYSYTQTTSDNASNVSVYIQSTCTANDWPYKLESWSITGTGPTGSGGETSATTGTHTTSTKTKKIYHLSNGTQTFSATINVNLKYWDGSAWASKSFTKSTGSITLTTINVYPSVSFTPSSPEMQTTVTIAITKPSTTKFTATGVKIVAEYDGTETTIYEGTGASTTWSVPDLSATTPDSSTKAITIKAQSIRNGTYYSAKEFTLNAQVQAAYVPSCAIGTITDNYNYSSFISGYSLLTIPVNSGTAGSGASIVSYSVQVRNDNSSGAIIYEATNTTTAATTSFTMTTPIQTATTYVKVTITDSRGRTATATQTVSATAYQQPQIALTAERCDSGGTADPVGAYVKIVCSWSITQIGADNNLAERVRIYMSTDGNTFTQIDARYVAAGTYSETYYIIQALSTNSQGWFYAKTRDNISPRVTSSTKIVPRIIIPMSLYDDGSNVGMTLGEAANSAGFNCKMDANFLVNGAMGGVLVDYVIEQGTDGDWTYRKWASGKAECWASVSFTLTTKSAWTSGSGLYYSNVTPKKAYPASLFVAMPILFTSITGPSGSATLYVLSARDCGSATETDEYRLISSSSSTGASVTLNYHAIGSWK
jgi:hypothetical protein